MEVVKKGSLVQEKIIPRQKCGECKSPLYMQVYRYDNGLTKIVHCKKCMTYSQLKKPKNYNVNFKPVVKSGLEKPKDN